MIEPIRAALFRAHSSPPAPFSPENHCIQGFVNTLFSPSVYSNTDTSSSERKNITQPALLAFLLAYRTTRHYLISVAENLSE
ncbi:hypothetical protein [Pikeienuella sp. HZG-20]|uniref:hypothetical protein n=1 Tax=Paludibacillus litoralis TaxID=3133267 RepID=UPI0030EEC22B